MFDLCFERERLRADQILEVQDLEVPLNILWRAPLPPNLASWHTSAFSIPASTAAFAISWRVEAEISPMDHFLRSKIANPVVSCPSFGAAFAFCAHPLSHAGCAIRWACVNNLRPCSKLWLSSHMLLKTLASSHDKVFGFPAIDISLLKFGCPAMCCSILHLLSLRNLRAMFLGQRAFPCPRPLSPKLTNHFLLALWCFRTAVFIALSCVKASKAACKLDFTDSTLGFLSFMALANVSHKPVLEEQHLSTFFKRAASGHVFLTSTIFISRAATSFVV